MLKFGPLACLPGCLRFLEHPDIEQLEGPVASLVEIQRNVPWWIGDLVNYGLAIHGDDFFQVFPEKCSLEMLNRYAAIAREFEPDERFPDLSFTHHQHVMKYEKPIRAALLQKATDCSWGSDQLRDYIRKVYL